MNKNELNDICKEECFHKDAINKVKENIPSDKTLLNLSEIFKILGDYTRIRILNSLLYSELCVCDLSNLLKMSQSAISHQLRILRTARIVKYRREGKNVFYSLDDDHISGLLNQGLDHVHHI